MRNEENGYSRERRHSQSLSTLCNQQKTMLEFVNMTIKIRVGVSKEAAEHKKNFTLNTV